MLKKHPRALLQKKINIDEPEHYFHEMVEYRTELHDNRFDYKNFYRNFFEAQHLNYLNANGPLEQELLRKQPLLTYQMSLSQ